jgi:hypothetical protein
MRNDIGLSPLSTPPSLEGLEEEARIEAMVDWFFENFEDPVHETSYNSREGGYLYIHGGPYEASDYISDAFPDATEDEHSEAIERIDGDGPDFAPAGHRILPPDEDYDEQPPSQLLTVRLDALGGQLEEIKGHINAMLALQRQELEEQVGPPPAGHNNPPPSNQPDLYDILDSVREVEEELAQTNRITDANVEVINRAEGRFNKFLSWLVGLAKEAPSLLARGDVTGVGGWAITYALNHQSQVVHLIGSATETLGIWASVVGHLF